MFKDVFIQLYTPFSLKIREQAIIRLSVFNYGDKNITDVSDISASFICLMLVFTISFNKLQSRLNYFLFDVFC